MSEMAAEDMTDISRTTEVSASISIQIMNSKEVNTY
jgi:hypothetical protein